MRTDLAIIFDLDDTLYHEVDFLVSAFRAISVRVENTYGITGVYAGLHASWRRGEDVFQWLIDTHSLPVEKAELIAEYRSHKPQLTLDESIRHTLQDLRDSRVSIGLMTDGRSVTQRNKIKALGLAAYFPPQAILISEEFGSSKPCESNYTYFMQLFGMKSYVYIGDNPQKDFIIPNKLGWFSACVLDDGKNIHPQDRTLPASHQPSLYVESIVQLLASDIIDVIAR